MKHKLTLAAALLMGSTALSMPALAKDDMGVKAGQSTEMKVQDKAPGLSGSSSADVDANAQGNAYGNTKLGVDSDLSADVDTTASTNAKANYGQVISSLRSGSSNAAKIEGMADVSSVNVVRIDSLTGEGDPQALENAINDNQDQVSELQDAIDANQSLKTKLEAESLAASDVVATDIGADGAVTLYVR